MKRQIKLTIAYDGTHYSGFQIQKNGLSVSEVLNEGVSRMAGRRVTVLCVSRTDAGVHAMGQIGTFYLEHSIPVEKIPRAIQCYLPDDVRILKAEEVPLSFRCFQTVGKHYRYVVRTSYESPPFDYPYLWHLPLAVKLEPMAKVISLLEGSHDFRAFTAAHSGKEDFVRTVNNIYVTQKRDDFIFDVWGEGFLYKMVRSIVGCLVDVGRGFLSAETVAEALVTGNRDLLGYTAPSRGLTLIKIYYDEQFFLDKEENIG